ncbi:putative transport accessory protein MmpS2 [Mycobacterium simulans]|uniref:Putative transport accessory protein MmpS2 n=2 Tax=Mycobacterium simulans TaxID=627089 RepID=A0A7Z7IJD5_9MYCO|nr:putative transport accessory protein MmpS2 [Mycobacterium simulans]SON59026.1 putative transport accessory protein MmpS2 [Mycobacterium simulans]
MIRVTGIVKRIWLLLAIVAVTVVAGSTIYRLHRIFGVHEQPVARVKADDDAPQFNPKIVTYEVFGAAPTAKISFLDPDARVKKLDGVPLPWSETFSTPLPAVSVNLLAQSNGDVLSCRILVNGVVKDEKTETGLKALTVCQVTAA